jgi:ribosomal protein S18 acetylase RimI-like enzyme
MIEDIKISKAALGDMDSVIALQKEIFDPGTDTNYTHKFPKSHPGGSARPDYENYLILKAEIKNEIVGCVKVRETGEFCWIENLIVAPQFQKMGIGTSLMNEVEKAFPKTRLYLLCTGYRQPENMGFYESLGYKKRELSHEGQNQFLLVKRIQQNLKS